MDSDPVSHLLLVHTGGEAIHWYSLSTLLFFLFFFLKNSFRWGVHCSPCWPFPASLATFCLCDQWNHQLAERFHFGNGVWLRCSENPALIYYLWLSGTRSTFYWFCGCIHLWYPLSVQDGLGQFCFLIFVAYTISSGVFLLWFIPETKGRTMVEIMREFNRLNYKNAGIGNSEIILSTQF